MAARKLLSLICLLAAGSCSCLALASNSPDIRISNAVSECLEVSPGDSLVHNNVVLLDARLSVIKSVGYCGCKSANLSYYSIKGSDDHGNVTPMDYSVFVPSEDGVYTFVVESDFGQNDAGPRTLNIQCAGPL